MIRILLVLVLLVGCVAPPPTQNTPQYRDTSAGIGSIAILDAKRFAGDWVVRGAFGAAHEIGRSKLRFLPASGGYQVFGLGGPEAEEGALYRFNAPARLSGPQELWVLWVDVGYRTAVLGNPDGSIGLIIDRSAKGGADRLAAAKKILGWAGYAMARFREK